MINNYKETVKMCIEKIRSKCVEVLKNTSEYEVWKLQYYNDFIIYKQLKHDGKYLDGCEYKFPNDSMFTLSIPVEFFNDYYEEHEILPCEQVTFKYLKKVKAKRISGGNSILIYFDTKNKYFYYTQGNAISRKRVLEYEKFKKTGLEKAVLIKTTYSTDSDVAWYESIESFLEYFKRDLYPKYTYMGTDFGCGVVKYQVLRRGYLAIHPHERKIFTRLPYFNIDKEYARNQNIMILARQWANRMDSKITATECFEYVIRKYLAWKDKNKS